MELTSILAKAEKGEQLSREDAVALLRTDNTSSSFYQLIAAANERSRRVFGNKGYIFALQRQLQLLFPGREAFCGRGAL